MKYYVTFVYCSYVGCEVTYVLFPKETHINRAIIISLHLSNTVLSMCDVMKCLVIVEIFTVPYISLSAEIVHASTEQL